MSDNTTIVKRLSNQLKKVTDLLQVKVVGLNRVEPKYNSHSPEGRTKGVDSDHIKIFQLAPDKSFAFAFFYASAKPPYVMASMKLGQTLTSAQYSEVTFKEKLNDFVKLLEILKESNNLNPKSAESTFLTNFIKGKEYNPTEAVDETMARIKDRMKAIKKKYVTKIEKKNKLVLDLEKKKTEIQAKVAKAQEKENIEELKKSFMRP
jgi:hypothetical protein